MVTCVSKEENLSFNNNNIYIYELLISMIYISNKPYQFLHMEHWTDETVFC